MSEGTASDAAAGAGCRGEEFEALELLLTDMNGIVRGKRVRSAEIPGVLRKGINLPAGSYLMDSQGDVIDGLSYGTDDGDPDMYCTVLPGSLAPVPWDSGRLGQAMLTMHDRGGKPCFAEPRHVLARAMQPLNELGLTAVIAVELEFYLLADDAPHAPAVRVGRIPAIGAPQPGPSVYSLEDLADFGPFFDGLAAACDAQGIPAGTAISEFSPGQFEVNLHHVADPLAACDHAILLRRAVRGVARQQGMAATFMAKPIPDLAGSGMHVHVSLVDSDGHNIFAGDRPGGWSESLEHATGGLAAAMAESMAVFCPNGNSYRRFQPGFYAPVAANWGLNHRNVSLRIPLSDSSNMRVEHRAAGADANPYLVVACILAGLHHGLANKLAPPPMVPEGGKAPDEVTLPTRWAAALDAYDAGSILPRYFGEKYHGVFSECRRGEEARFHGQISNRDYEWYLRSI
jgi:glutamine synthetase